MKKSILLITLLSMVYLSATAQYQVNLTLSNIKDSLAYFRLCTFDEKLFIPKDTSRIKKNVVKFASTTSIFGGIYYVSLPASNKKIQLCIENKDMINLKLDGSLPLDSIYCSDPENKVFIKYQALESKYQYIDSQYNDLLKKGNASLKFKESLYKPKKDTLSAFRKQALRTLKTGSVLHKHFTWLNTLDEFSPNRQEYAQREKFLRQFPLQDAQLYFSPLLKPIIYEYLSSYPLQADSTLKGIEAVMKRLDCKDKAYPNTFNYFTNVLQNNTIKNNIEGYMDFIETYLINNKCSFLPKNREAEYLTKYKQFKQIAGTDSITNISLKDTAGIKQDLGDVVAKHDYTIISFFDPSCEHCKVQMPELDLTVKSVLNQTNLSLSIYAICNTNFSMEKDWKTFITEHALSENFVHVILGDDDSPRVQYAAYGNPMFFLVDQNKKILLKKTTVSAIKKFLLGQKK